MFRPRFRVFIRHDERGEMQRSHLQQRNHLPFGRRGQDHMERVTAFAPIKIGVTARFQLR